MLDEIKQLIQIREEYCIVRSVASREIGITESALYRLENGNSEKPKPQTLLKIRAYIERIKKEHDEAMKSDIEKATDPILDFINSSFELIPWPSSARRFQPTIEREGLLFHSIFLKNLTTITDEKKDVAIDVIEQLCRTGHLKCFGLIISHKISDEDFKIRFELGRGERDLSNRLEIKIVRLYRYAPLTEQERGAREVILNIRERIESERIKKDEWFETRYGSSDGHTTEFLIRRQEREESMEQREAILSLKDKKK